MTHVAAVAVAGSILLCGLGCTSTSPDLADALQRAEDRWAASGPSHYQMRVTIQCYCPLLAAPVVAEVQDAAVTALVFADSLSVPADTLPYGRFITVERLFALVREAISQNAARLQANYATGTGYPTSVSVDYDRTVADDELDVRVDVLTPLP
jgi:hypothetical protein